MKILFVSTYDLRRNTSSNIRTIALIQALAKMGHNVYAAYIPSQHVPDSKIQSCIINSCDFVIPLMEVADEDTLKTVEKPSNKISYKQKIKNIILEVYNKICIYDIFQVNIRKIRVETIDKLNLDYDVIVSSSEPRSSHKLAKKLIKRGVKAKLWVLYWGDPITNDVASKKIFPFREHIIEKQLIKNGDLSIYTNQSCCEYMKKKYPDYSSKISWIPTSDILSNQKEKIREEYYISYVGDYRSDFRNIIPFYETCKCLRKQSVIAGGSDINLNSCESIRVLGRVSKEQADRIEQGSSILVVLDNEKKGRENIQVPGKMYHYALTNKYILVISNADSLEKYYSHYERYVFAHNTVDSIIEGLRKIENGELPLSYCSPVKSFTQESIAENFTELLSKGLKLNDL